MTDTTESERITFVYYIPGMKSPTAQDIVNAGLRHAFDGDPEIMFHPTPGPDGNDGGSVLCDKRSKPANARDGRDPATMEWRQIPKTISWIGWKKGAMPGPEQLERKEMLKGHRIKMANGETWLCPAAHEFDSADETFSSPLPKLIGMDKDGNYTLEDVIPRYAEFWKVGKLYFDILVGAIADSDDLVADMNLSHEIRDATICLGANYRTGAYEPVLLKLFTKYEAFKILKASADWPTIEAWDEKKKEADG